MMEREGGREMMGSRAREEREDRKEKSVCVVCVCV
jgi:hypothetical protein